MRLAKLISGALITCTKLSSLLPALPPVAIDVQPLAILNLEDRIATQEGYYVSGTLPQQYNNPCALVYIRQAGAILGRRGYANFTSPLAGWLACYDDLLFKINHGISFNRAWAYLE